MASDAAAGPDAMIDALLHAAKRHVLTEEDAITLADAALDHAREDEALPAVAASAARARASAPLWQWTALLHRGLDRREEALHAFDRAQRLAPADPRIAHGIARTRLEAGLPAVDSFEQALRLAPRDGEVVLGRAAACCAAGLADRAIADLDARLARAPGWIAGHESVSRLRWAHADRAGFLRSLERAIAGQPRAVGLWLTLLRMLTHAGAFEAMLDATRRARPHLGDHVVLLAHEAIALSELGRLAEADAAFARLAGHSDPTVELRRVRHLLRAGRPDPAGRLAESLIGTVADHFAWPYLSIAWRLTGDRRWDWLEGDEALVGVYDLADRLPPLDRLADGLRRLHDSTYQPLDQSLRGGTQTDGALFARIEADIQATRAVIAETVARHIARLPQRDARHPTLRVRRDRAPRFAGSWSVRLHDAGFHANHTHPEGWFSSALYVALPDMEAGSDAGWLTQGEPEAELGLGLAPFRSVQPRPGRLALFPSTMWHGTRPFRAGERMTIAFDIAHPPA